jgi:hypothetical protein
MTDTTVTPEARVDAQRSDDAGASNDPERGNEGTGRPLILLRGNDDLVCFDETCAPAGRTE